MYIHDHIDIYIYSRSGMRRHGFRKKHMHIYVRIDEKQRSVYICTHSGLCIYTHIDICIYMYIHIVQVGRFHESRNNTSE